MRALKLLVDEARLRSRSDVSGLKKALGDRFFFIGLASLIWFLLRTGTKPSRIAYPCQRAALANASLWLALYVLPLAGLIKPSRRLLALSLAALAVAAVAVYFMLPRRAPSEEIQLEVRERVATLEPSSKIFVVTNARGRYQDVATLVRLMGEHGLKFYKSEKVTDVSGPDGLIARDDVIIIKVNSQWDQRGGTNTDLVKALIQVILEHPDGFEGEIVIADNGQAQYGSRGTGGSLNWERNNAEDTTQSMERVAQYFAERGYRVSTYLWDTITLKRVREYSEGDMEDGYIVYDSPDPDTGVIVSYPKFRTKFGTYISFKLGVWDPDSRTYDSARLKVINVPVLKTHSIYGVTACVKHYMGVVSDRLTNHNPHNSVGRGGMGTVMVETRMPVLNIIDAIWINPHPRMGPATPYGVAVRTNIIAASVDPVALDYWAAKYILMRAAAELGYKDLSSMDPDNTFPGAFGHWLRLSMNQLVKAGYFSTVDEARMSVYVRTSGG
ncbi:MAG: DUF362 domain-containing protein [Thermofilaceae archaeon]